MDPFQHPLPLLVPAIDDAWKDIAAIEAPKLISRRRPEIRKAAVALAQAHPFALDYLRQAPILITATGLHKKRKGSTGRKVLAEWEMWVRAKPKLRDLMARYNLHYQTRKLDGWVAHVGQCWAPRLMQTLRADPMALADAIPKNRTRQGRWLACCSGYYSRMLQKVPEGGLEHRRARVVWATLAMGRGEMIKVSQACDLADFVWACGDGFNEAWSLSGALKRCAEWHASLQRNRPRPYVAPEARPLDPAPFPLEWRGGGQPFKVVMLLTERDLFDEGVAMNHCVRDYWKHVVSGRSRIFSIRFGSDEHADVSVFPKAEGGRLCTFELIRTPGFERATVHGYESAPERWTLSQLQGPRPVGADWRVPAAPVPWATAIIEAFSTEVLGYAAKKHSASYQWRIVREFDQRYVGGGYVI